MLLIKTSIRILLVSFIIIGITTNTGFSISVSDQVHSQAMFVFGDSLVDPGNNNDLISRAKTNYKPMGIDFPLGVTGRACNGATIADHLGYLLGLGLIPGFSKLTKKSSILKGLNFASEACGILNDTGYSFGGRFSMNKQIDIFTKILHERASSIGGDTDIQGFLAKSLFSISIGTNDYITNYFNPPTYEFVLYPANAYRDLLIQGYTSQLTKLYNLGGRRFLITSLPPIGCMPYIIVNFNKKDTKCVDKFNKVARLFNCKLMTMVQNLNKNLVGAYFLYWDIYSGLKEIVNNPSRYGIKNPSSACCGAGRLNSDLLCLQNVPFVCANRSEYLFWDSFHPSDATNAIIAKQAYEGVLQNTYPMNVQQLLRL